MASSSTGMCTDDMMIGQCLVEELCEVMDLDETALVTVKSESPPVAVKMEDVNQETPSKRRRRLPPSGCIAPATDTSDIVKAPTGEESVAGQAGSNAEQTPERKSCPGCRRVLGESPDYVALGEVVVWALPNGRGAWCQNCHTLWRTCFRDRQALTWFAGWLTDDPAHREEWDWHLLA